VNDDSVKVLIVEDDTDLQMAYEMILSSQGHIVRTANDGIEGLNALHQFQPEIIMLDYFMPRMDGKSFLQNFNADEYPNVKIIVASNISDRTVIDEMLALGASHYILKADISPTDLIRLIDDVAHSKT
jgi:CheY-like chemotaxis protein